MLSTKQLGIINDHFGSETAAPAVFAAVTAVAGYVRRAARGSLSPSRQRLILSTQQLGTIHDHFRSETAAPAVYAAFTQHLMDMRVER